MRHRPIFHPTLPSASRVGTLAAPVIHNIETLEFATSPQLRCVTAGRVAPSQYHSLAPEISPLGNKGAIKQSISECGVLCPPCEGDGSGAAVEFEFELEETREPTMPDIEKLFAPCLTHGRMAPPYTIAKSKSDLNNSHTSHVVQGSHPSVPSNGTGNLRPFLTPSVPSTSRWPDSQQAKTDGYIRSTGYGRRRRVIGAQRQFCAKNNRGHV
ncbi:hypothetical protein B0H19DRAFT_1075865 [Mycena capillaripes]|nr:hypothetical protein B0H19DRAFT_1075865 [Mycena capillaripes]